MTEASFDNPPPPLRIALVAGPDTMHHVGRVVQHLTVGLVDELISVTLVAPAMADVSNLPCPPVEVLRYAPSRLPLLRWRAVDALADALEQREVEVLHALDARAHELTCRLSDRIARPYVVSPLGTTNLHALRNQGELCRALLAGSEAIRQEVLARHLAPPERVVVVRPGVHQIRTPATARRADHSVALLVGGALDVYQPFATVLESFAALREEGDDCVFFVLGNGQQEHRLRRRAEQLDLMHALTFVDRPAQHQLANILKAANIFIYPQSDGDLEMEILEAMAAAVPCLVGGPCVGDFVADAETALAYDASSREDLTGKLRVLLADPSAGARLADTARTHLRERHSPARMVAALAELYRQNALRQRTLRLS